MEPPPPPPCIYSSAATDHLSIGYERLTQLRAFLLTSSPAKPNTTAPAIGLLDKALHCVASALSELQTSSPSCISAAAVEDNKNDTDPRKRRKTRIQSWTIVTTVPHFDGHQWRKYGQKHIHRSKFPRSYYKCTYSKDQGCPSTKTIQQKEDEDSNPPKYEVRYSMQHSCKAMETHAIPFVMDSSAIRTNTSSTATSSTCSSQELSTSSGLAASPPALPVQVADIDEYSLSEDFGLMESILLSTEPKGVANFAESSNLRSPALAALDFDWEWLMG